MLEQVYKSRDLEQIVEEKSLHNVLKANTNTKEIKKYIEAIPDFKKNLKIECTFTKSYNDFVPPETIPPPPPIIGGIKSGNRVDPKIQEKL